MTTPPIQTFCCHNPKCANYGIRAKGNLRWHKWIGHSHRIRGIHCPTCDKYFSERSNVPEHSRLPEKKVESLLKHLCKWCGVQQTYRLIQVNQNTITHYARLAKNHVLNLHDKLLVASLTYFVTFNYNFCWPVQTLSIKNQYGDRTNRSPAITSGLTNHIWTTREWISFLIIPIRST